MIINNNIPAMNTHRQMGINQQANQNSMEKLSSGLRINKAGDDAAGLAISEKMRAQINGLDQASRNSQDGISMIQTAEGALSETHSILQRMRELATQASNDTNVDVDRDEIQKEMNELTSEINRIGNTTEFNTQEILKGDGGSSLDSTGLVDGGKLQGGEDVDYTQATQTTTITGAADHADDGIEWDLNGVSIDITFDGEEGNLADADETAEFLRTRLQEEIDNNDVLNGNYEVTGTGDEVTVTATEDGEFKGSAGTIGTETVTDTNGNTFGATAGGADSGTTTPAIAASTAVDFADLEGGDAAETDANIEALVGTGMTINGEQIEFYNANDGEYSGEATGVNISDALVPTAASGKVDQLVTSIAEQVGGDIEGVELKAGDGAMQYFDEDGNAQTASTTHLVIEASTAGESGNDLEISDGGVKEDFSASFQIGANQGQSLTVDINDMRANALGISGTTAGGEVDGVEDAAFTENRNVTDGTNSTNVEYALDVSTHDSAAAAQTVINNAIESVSAERSSLGASQNRLEHTISNLDNSAENLSAAESRIRDVDMAAEMMEMTRSNILSQASQSMLAQANQQPQSVLQLLG
ncbi:flagellin [Alteribacillus sp. JSM 102045]|uniref:flagellin N-terminal helical domain-containing protein n=1 Tax=Alteribacillus sp. JSM 102045 TaxID=1562101 RepID=UPI0035BF6AD4